jgi:hypothetical protein
VGVDKENDSTNANIPNSADPSMGLDLVSVCKRRVNDDKITVR